MDNNELQRIAESLEDSINGEPQSRLSSGKPWPWLTLNRAGCIALASNLLRLASKPESSDGTDVVQHISDINQINDGDNDLEIFLLRRMESMDLKQMDESADSPRLKDRLAMLGCGLVVIMVATIFLSGIYFWGQLILGEN